ncbi:MAG: isochorismatase family protein [Capnocytophaga sp.]|nr:isochorismatase family protein [Capnocytophaga sp.]
MNLQNVQLVILDIQGKLSEIVYQSEEMLRNAHIAIEGSKILEIPSIWVEQMPDKLGATHPMIAETLEGKTSVKKSSFSAFGNTEFVNKLTQNNRKQVLLIGIETHICIYQTAIDLLSDSYEVFVITDAVSSRTESNKQIGLQMLTEAGAKLFSTEAMLFALLRTALHPKFRKIAKLVK